jgi:hypothetical protein
MASQQHFYLNTATAAIVRELSRSARALCMLALLIAGAGTAHAVAANDSFASRTLVSSSLPAVSSGNNTGATPESGEPSIANSTTVNSVWWRWVAPATGDVVVSTKGSGFDTLMGVYTGSVVSSLTAVPAINLSANPSDDYSGGGSHSFVIFTATQGVEYQIKVDGYGASVGAIVLNVQNRPSLTLAVTAGASEPSQNGQFRFTLSNSLVDTLSVQVSLGGTATAGTDYTSLATTYTLPANTLTTNVTVTPFDDVLIEGNESIQMTIQSNVYPGYSIGSGAISMTLAEDEPIYVAADVAGGSNNGRSWANAYSNLATALAASASGNQIWVKAGTYKPTTGADRNIGFVLKSGVKVYGGFAGTEAVVTDRNYATNLTILSGDIGALGNDTDNSYNVIDASLGGTIDGLIVTKGNSNSGATTALGGSGGGLYASGAVSVTIDNCIFDTNKAPSYGGGAVAAYLFATVTIRGCLFYNNSGGWGGALIAEDSGTMIVTNCTFFNNTGSGKCIQTFSGGVATFKNCIMRDGGTSLSLEIANNAAVSSSSSFCNIQGSGGSSAWASGQGTNGGNNIDSDPKFVDSTAPKGADGIFGNADDGLRLQAGSPSADTGSNVATPVKDLLYGTRTLATTIDMGAYEGKVPLITFGASTSNGSESTTPANLAVNLSGISDLTATVNYAVAGGGTATGGGVDYTLASGTLTFTPGVLTQNVVVTVVSDAIDENGETVLVALGSTTNGKVSGTTTHTFTINDDDEAGITVSLAGGGASLTTTEAAGGGHTSTFSVVLTSQPTDTVQTVITSNVTAEGLVHTTGAPGANVTLTFTTSNWNTPQTVTVTGVNDSLDDNDVTYTITTAPATSTDPNYSGRDPNDVTVKNIDDDIAGITIPSSFASATEAAGASHTKTFTIVLTSQPYAPVTFTLASSDTTEARLASGSDSVVLDSTNWSIGATITVIAEDDAVDDGNIAFAINVAKSQCPGDSAYNNLGGWSVTSTCIDDDTKGTTVSQSAGSTAVTEGGTTDSYTVVLNSQPTATVTVTISGNTQIQADTDTSTTGVQNTLTFTTTNWNVAQTVTVTAVDDNTIEGLHSGTITHVVAGGDYATVTISNIIVPVTDNDVAGFIISPVTTTTDRLNTSEAGGSATFSVSLATQPAAGKTVTVNFATDDTTEGVQSTTSMSFTATSTDGGSDTFNFGAEDLSGVKVGQSVYVSGGGANDKLSTYVIAVDDGLNTVTVFDDILASAGGEIVTIWPRKTLTFGNADWNTPQSVQIIGRDDLVTDTDIDYTVACTIDTSSGARDLNYDGVTASDYDVYLTNIDDDVPGVSIIPSGGSTDLDEDDTTATETYTVRLNTLPTANVAISISADSQCTVDKTNLFFTTANWNVTQTVTVTVVDDFIAEGSPHFGTITHTSASTDGNYNALTINSISASIADNDTAGFNVIPTNGLVTNEGGGTATFIVSLTSKPTANVVLGVVSSNTAEGTVPAPTLTFTPANWFIPRGVVITGINDLVDDGDVAYGITLSADTTTVDASYVNMDPPDVSVTNQDNDTAGVTLSKTATTVTEAGTTDTYTVALNTKPTAGSPVVITISADSQCSVDGGTSATLTFDPAVNDPDPEGWDLVRTITVAAVDDGFVEGAHTGTIHQNAAGGGYSDVSIPNVSVAITDNDSVGVTVTALTGDTSEAGATATFTMKLDSKPTANVTVLFTVSDTTEGTVSPSRLLFTPANYSVAQTATVIGVNDAIDDDDVDYEIESEFFSVDTNYNAYSVTNIDVTNLDNDATGMTVSAISGPTTEAGGIALFSVTLTSEPTDAVAIDIASDDTGEGTVDTSSLSFSSTNWMVAQYVVVTGVDDDIDDGDIPYAVEADPSSNADALYDAYATQQVAVVNNDDDAVGIRLSTTTVATTENGASRTVNVQLTSEPTGNVTITIDNNGTDEGTLDTNSLSFTSGNWSTAQTLEISPTDDFLVDGNQSYTIDLVAAGGDYGAITSLITVTNGDDDVAGFDVTAAGNATTENGVATKTITVVLTSKPSAPVTITATGWDVDEGSLDTDTLLFSDNTADPDAWNIPQVITVSGEDDFVDDGNITYSLTLTPDSTDLTYDGLATQLVSITNNDDDTEGVTIDVDDGVSVAEGGNTDTYTIALDSQPTGLVTITLDCDDQVTANATVLTFDPTLTSPAANGWNRMRTITVTAVVDSIDEASPDVVDIAHDVVGYGSVSGEPVEVEIIDDEKPTVGGTLSLTLARGDSDDVTAAELFATDAEIADTDDLIFTVLLSVSQGTLRLNGTALAENETFTMGDINAGLLTYDHNIASSGAADGFAFRITDNAGNTSSLSVFHFTITGFIAPIITFATGNITYTEGAAGGVAIDTIPQVDDGDSADFDGGGLTVGFTANDEASDELFINDNGTVGIGLSAGSVLYNNVAIGTWSGTNPLVVTFSSSAVDESVANALMAAIRFRNTSQSPSGATRTVYMQMVDDSGTTGNQCTKNIAVVPVNDAPAIAFASNTAVSYTENASPAQIDALPTISDDDSSDFDGGGLEVGFLSNDEAADGFIIQNNGAVGIGLSGGTTVTFNNVAIGTWNGSDGSGGAPLIVTFTAAVTPSIARALMQNIKFRSTSESPSELQRTMYMELTDDTGTVSNQITKAIDVDSVIDAPSITLVGAGITYTENDAPTIIDAGATVADDDSADFDGGSLTVAFTVNGTGSDEFIIHNNGAVGIGRSGGNVLYDNAVIGTWSGTRPLVVTFNNSGLSTPAAVEALVQNIEYRNTSESPTSLQRTISMVLVDDTSTASSTVTTTIDVVPVSDAPIVAFAGGNLTYTEGDLPLLIDSSPTITDLDSGNFSSGSLTVAITNNGEAGDELIINDNGASGIGLSGNFVTYNGVTFASWSGSRPLLVSFTTSGATPAVVTELLQNIQFQNTTQQPTTSTRTIQVTVVDNTTTTSNQPTKDIDVITVDDAPSVTFVSSSALTYTENDSPLQIDSGPAVTDADTTDFDGGSLEAGFTANDEVGDAFIIQDNGNVGIGFTDPVVTYNGVAIGTWNGADGGGGSPLIVNFTAPVTASVVNALMRNIKYQFNGQSPTAATRSVYFQVTDDTGTTSNQRTKGITVDPVEDLPFITLASSGFTYTEGDGLVLVDAAATVSDLDSTDFDGGSLAVAFTAGSDANDGFVIQNTGNLGIVLAGSDVTYLGTVIGSWSGTRPLLVDFNSSATQAAVQALIQNIQYRNNSQNPTNLQRTISMQLVDDTGTDGNLVTMPVDVVPVNDAPVISFAGGNLSFTEDDSALLIDSLPTVTDLDSTDFNGGSLTVEFTANDESGDQFIIRNNGSTGIGLSGSSVTWNGSAIGTYSGTNPLVVNFTSTAATLAVVTSLLQNIQYQNAMQDPNNLTRTMQVTIVDDTNTTSNVPTKDIDMTPVNDAPVITNTFFSVPANVASTLTLTVVDVDNYPLTIAQISGQPIKGTVAYLVTAVPDDTTDVTFQFTPNTNASGLTSFTIQATDPDLATSAVTTITINIIGDTVTERPWIISDPPFEAEAGSSFSYDILLAAVDQDAFNTNSGTPELWTQYTLIGTLPDGATADDDVTTPGFQRAPNGYDAALGLNIGANVTGYLDLGVVVTDPASNTSTYQRLLIKIVPAGTLTN